MSTQAPTHELKTWPQYFTATWDGDKPFDVRYDDRGYQKGDELALREWDPRADCSCTGRGHSAETCARYTGRIIFARVGFVTASTPARGQQRGFFGNGYVVLGLVDLERVDGRDLHPAGVDDRGRVVSGINLVASASRLPTEVSR